VYDWDLARWIGVPVWELETVPSWYLDQARVIREAHRMADAAKAGERR
jgi:hypothetical protein